KFFSSFRHCPLAPRSRMSRPVLRFTICLLAGVQLLGLDAAGKVVFNRDVRPIFSDTCFRCHGPDEAKRKAGLRLDTRETAVKPAESGATAIVPGKPDESELVKRLTTMDKDEVMPPPKLH